MATPRKHQTHPFHHSLNLSSFKLELVFNKLRSSRFNRPSFVAADSIFSIRLKYISFYSRRHIYFSFYPSPTPKRNEPVP